MTAIPFSLRGRGAFLAMSACLAALLFTLAGELLAPGDSSLGALMVVPVAAAAWFLPIGGSLAVIGLAVVIRLAAVVEGVPPVTVASEILLLVVAATALRVAGSAVLRLRAQDLEMKGQAERLAMAAERERIAEELTATASRVLFATTLDLQAAVSVMREGPARARVQAAVGEIDGVQSHLREGIFQPGRRFRERELTGPAQERPPNPS